MPSLALPSACLPVAMISFAGFAGCCFGGGERTVLAQSDLSCGSLAVHVERVHVVTNAFEGVSVVTRELSFADGTTLEASSGVLGPWRPREELPEHVRSPRMTDADSAWLLTTPSDAHYRCLTEHLPEIEAVFADQPLVVFHATEADVVPTFTAERDGVSLAVQLETDGSLSARIHRGDSDNGMLIGQMVREPGGRVLALVRDSVFTPGLPADFANISSMVGVARDEQGRTLLERFPSETRVMDITELLQLPRVSGP